MSINEEVLVNLRNGDKIHYKHGEFLILRKSGFYIASIRYRFGQIANIESKENSLTKTPEITYMIDFMAGTHGWYTVRYYTDVDMEGKTQKYRTGIFRTSQEIEMAKIYSKVWIREEWQTGWYGQHETGFLLRKD